MTEALPPPVFLLVIVCKLLSGWGKSVFLKKASARAMGGRRAEMRYPIAPSQLVASAPPLLELFLPVPFLVVVRGWGFSLCDEVRARLAGRFSLLRLSPPYLVIMRHEDTSPAEQWREALCRLPAQRHPGVLRVSPEEHHATSPHW